MDSTTELQDNHANKEKKEIMLDDNSADNSPQGLSISSCQSNMSVDVPSKAQYHQAVGSYKTSLKDAGTGVRPLIK